MAAKREEQSELVMAARALENELRRFQVVADSLAKQKLDSGTAVERAGRQLAEASECEERIAQSVVALSNSIQALNHRQAQQVQKLQQSADAIQSRALLYQQLMAQYEALGLAAQQLNERVRPMLGDANEPGNIAGIMQEVETGGDELAAQAQALVAKANEHGFADVIRLSDALRQQLLAALNKLRLLGTKIARA